MVSSRTRRFWASACLLFTCLQSRRNILYTAVDWGEEVEEAARAKLPEVCRSPPGEHAAEGGFLGYHVLYSMGYYLPNVTAPVSLACIRLHPTADIPDGCPEVTEASSDYEWYYLARPGRFLVQELLYDRIQRVRNVKGPSYLETRVLKRPNEVSKRWKFDRKATHREVTVVHRTALEGLSNTSTDYASIAQWATLIEQGNPYWPYHEYTVIGTRYPDRVHAILHGTCGVYETPRTTQAFDPYYLRHHPLPLDRAPVNHSICESYHEGPRGYEALTSKIKVSSGAQRKKVLCMVYSANPVALQSIAETWGPKCDGYLAGANFTDPTLGALNVRHVGPEDYSNMWHKIRAMWEYAYEHYLDDFDYFHIGGDDHYVIVENLQTLVGNWKGTWKEDEPLFLGMSFGDFPNPKRFRYCGGGGGYTLNRAALTLLMDELWYKPECWPYYRTSEEDRMMARCFRAVGIQCMDTNDEHNETRYHHHDAQSHGSWTMKKRASWWPHALRDHHGIAQLEQMGQISESSVSFHLKHGPEVDRSILMRRYHALIYGLCNSTNSTETV